MFISPEAPAQAYAPDRTHSRHIEMPCCGNPVVRDRGSLTHKSESFRLRFVLFTTIRSADFPLFPSSPARSNSILGQNWVRSCREESGAAKHEIKKCQKMKKTCIVRESTVYNPAVQKMGENEGGMSTRAAPMTFHVEKSTFRADGPTNRGKYATLII